MHEAPLPLDEAERLASLRGLGILYTPDEERFDRITRLACRLLDVPLAMVTLIDADVQWFKSRQGDGGRERPRTVSFCAHAILRAETMLIPNALLDPRFADNPLVVGGGELAVTASLGLTAAEPGAAAEPAALIHAADEALYRAKATGRDRVALAAG